MTPTPTVPGPGVRALAIELDVLQWLTVVVSLREEAARCEEREALTSGPQAVPGGYWASKGREASELATALDAIIDDPAHRP